jgi:V/A-type H+/Na+-transporting ATPase subunit F
MRYFIIGDEDSVLGFGMVGVEGKSVSDAAEADVVFTSVLKDHSVGIVMITESVAEMIRDKVDAYLFTEQFPLIVEIPDKDGRRPNRPGLRQMVNEAIGISL